MHRTDGIKPKFSVVTSIVAFYMHVGICIMETDFKVWKRYLHEISRESQLVSLL